MSVEMSTSRKQGQALSLARVSGCERAELASRSWFHCSALFFHHWEMVAVGAQGSLDERGVDGACDVALSTGMAG